MSRRVAIVTGASSGIGEATARLLDREGWAVVLVARRAERLERLAGELRDAHPLALDLTDKDAPARVLERAKAEGTLHLLVNNAGAAWRTPDNEESGGWENVQRTMEINFNAVVRLTEALLPLLRSSAPSSIVNVSSVAGRVGRARVGAYSASKFALAGWSESLYLAERGGGVHVGMVLPGFVATDGFPQEQLLRSRRTRWIVSSTDKVAAAVLEAGPGGKAERYVPRAWGAVPRLRYGAPGLWRRLTSRMGR